MAALVFQRAGIQALQLLMLPAVIWLAVLAAFGSRVARTVAVPIGYLYFAMPAWNLLSVPLQELTVRMVALLAPVIGLPATVSGTVFAFPNGARFVVTLACSGVGFLAQALAVAALLGELEDASFRRRIRLLGSMALIALATNWIRVLLLLLIGYAWGMNNVIVAHYHLEFGYVLFVIVLVAFVWIATRRVLPEPDEVGPPRAGSCVSGGFVAAAVALMTGPVLVALSTPDAGGETGTFELRLPAGQHAWRGPLPSADERWRPVFVGAHAQAHVEYQDDSGRTVETVAVGYAVQAQGRELINVGNSLLGDGGLAPISDSLVDAGDSTYREMVVVDPEGHRSVIWSVYDIGGDTFVVPLLSRLWYGVRSLARPTYSAQFAFRAACGVSCDEARGTLRNFVQGMGSELLSVTGQTTTRGRAVSPVRDRSSGPMEAST
jgi:EpsI family protein